tara:strand:+ start:118 stop:978 length:861 start_codon:yes stop_codon:yes gene_type:complete
MLFKPFFRRKLKKKKISNYVSNKNDLEYFNEELSKTSTIGIDTEFDWRTTYYPKLSLVQVSTARNIFVLDMLKLKDLQIFKNYIEDINFLKIFHSVRSDTIVLSKCLRCKAKNVFDIQVAEKILSNNEIKSYGKIVYKYFGINLDKNETNSNWLSRPLTLKQIDYAMNDVDYLIDIFNLQKKILIKKNLLKKVFFDSKKEAELGNQLLLTSRLNKKLKKLNKRSKEIFIWREKIAEIANVPPNHIFNEKYMNSLSRILPDDKLAKKKAMKIIGNTKITEEFVLKFL